MITKALTLQRCSDITIKPAENEQPTPVQPTIQCVITKYVAFSSRY